MIEELDVFKLNYAERDNLNRYTAEGYDTFEKLTLRDMIGRSPRNPRSVLVIRIMQATLGGASHVEDFAKYGISEPILYKDFYVE
ncbi:hypothetical protein HON01_11580 [Candidatus Woesearchaeota archaeon]|jgi:hypothetical protein|nr:hypothetical protein [Candidatus Woesearchaeota archaeon]MBT7368327.1 hypothetical protein [Candidatus Woesearchaeota archaeon]